MFGCIIRYSEQDKRVVVGAAEEMKRDGDGWVIPGEELYRVTSEGWTVFGMPACAGSAPLDCVLDRPDQSMVYASKRIQDVKSFRTGFAAGLASANMKKNRDRVPSAN